MRGTVGGGVAAGGIHGDDGPYKGSRGDRATHRGAIDGVGGAQGNAEGAAQVEEVSPLATHEMSVDWSFDMRHSRRRPFPACCPSYSLLRRVDGLCYVFVLLSLAHRVVRYDTSLSSF